MPGFNQKGPMGQGSMTGRKMGKCTNFGAGAKLHPDSVTTESQTQLPQDLLTRGFGRGMAWGIGRGRGRGGSGRGMGRQNRFRGGE